MLVTLCAKKGTTDENFQRRFVLNELKLKSAYKVSVRTILLKLVENKKLNVSTN